MNPPKGLWQDQVGQAINGWRSALQDAAPKIPFDQDKRQAVTVLLKDERIANDLFEERKIAHTQEGLDPIRAGHAAAQDLTELAKRFGGR